MVRAVVVMAAAGAVATLERRSDEVAKGSVPERPAGVGGVDFEGRLPGAPRPRRGREPADRHGVCSDFPLETSSSPSGTLDTSRVPTEGHTHAPCPHSVPGVKPSRRALSQPSGSGECPGPPGGRVPRLRPLWPGSRRESRLAGSARGRQP